MGDFEDKLEELETKRKRSNRGIISIILVGLLIFAVLFSYSQWERTQKAEIKVAKAEDGEVILQQQDELQEEENIRKELKRVQGELERIKKASENDVYLADKIKDLDIEFDKSSSIPVFYYKRKADGDHIDNVFKSIKNPKYVVEHVTDIQDSKKPAVNTIYVGASLNTKYIDALQKRLKENAIFLKRVPFVSGKGTEWKKNAIEIGYEKDTLKVNRNADCYVRVYAYKSNAKMKRLLETKLGGRGYQVRVFPDWPKKPSFFSNTTTLLYYSNDPVTKKHALDLSAWLSEKTGLRIRTKMGAGLGIDKYDKKKLFILHYNGSK